MIFLQTPVGVRQSSDDWMDYDREVKVRTSYACIRGRRISLKSFVKILFTQLKNDSYRRTEIQTDKMSNGHVKTEPRYSWSEVYPHSRGGIEENHFGKITLSTPDRDSSPDLHVIGSLVYCERDAVSEAGYITRIPVSGIFASTNVPLSRAVIFDEIDLTDLSFAECSIKNVNHSFQDLLDRRSAEIGAACRPISVSSRLAVGFQIEANLNFRCRFGQREGTL
uniref:Uncharacterized protein n=1 Tax=Timema douglasi TaxID=61478 RepID=A0A7R8VA48_TIMDO|nr:unnamed protein product [Timema douglasi]